LPNASERCSTCGDTAIVLRIVERDGNSAVGVDPDGERAIVQLDFVPGAQTGDTVLAHFGVAIALVPAEAVK
jgi:hydrogenase expression/formation protein HypC